MKRETFHDVIIIGAGPSGSVAAAMLSGHGHDVLVLEREQFPRFSIGESLLPQCMGILDRAGLLRGVVETGFQFKCGAAFTRHGERASFDFRDKFTDDWGTTYQVPRADFDLVLARGAAKAGANVLFRETVQAIDWVDGRPVLMVRDSEGQVWRRSATFVLDASGFGRVLPRLLELETPSSLPVRQAIFTHVRDHFPTPAFDRSRILVSIHPERSDVWYWAIPFSGGRASVGVVGTPEFLATDGRDLTERLRGLIQEDPNQRPLFADTEWDTPAQSLRGYSANVKALHGPGWALLGNAAEFLDPVFSSGVTIALRSAELAAGCVHRLLRGEPVDFQQEYDQPLRLGIETFRAFVTGWYDGTTQDIIFARRPDPDIRRMICAVLAGYAWDQKNPYVAAPRRLRVLAEQCASQR
ncbi:MAG: NAD(P)/FAD-dependent oxidoreductase [Myxococcales bacterium]|nr:NAD(P)/FAD-dependent oxidoreductase [Myxococcales bacterium]